MADETTPHGENEGPNETPDTPAETDWQAEARKWEKRSKENLATAKANETAAKRLAELEESQKTEAQKAQERLDAAEKRAVELELKATRAEVAAAKGVPVELLNGGTREELEASADALIQFKGAKPNGPVIPGQGTAPAAGSKTTAELFAEAFNQD
jgi:hypothetical protein